MFFLRVLLLGAGMVAKPALDDLSQSGIDVTIGLLSPFETNQHERAR